MRPRHAMPVGAAAVALCAGHALAQSFAEGFESGTLPAGWTAINRSNPMGTSVWHAGATNASGNIMFGPHGGSFLATTDYFSGSGLATISNWLLTPQVTLRTNDTLSFWTRSTDGFFPD